MAKNHDKFPDGKKRTPVPAERTRRDAAQGVHKRKLLQKHYNNKYRVGR